MVTSVPLHPPAWMDGVQVAANDLRLEATSAFLTSTGTTGTTGITARQGVRPAGNHTSPLLVQAASGMNVTINAGTAFVQGTASATAGMYTGVLDTTATLTVTTSNPTNPRIDNVIAQFVDNGNNTSTGTINIQAGTPAPSPVAPTLPANSLLLGTIAVAALATSIVTANITDKRVYTVASGGILPMDTSGGFNSYGGVAIDVNSARLSYGDSSGNARQLLIAKAGAVYNQITGGVATVTGSYTTLTQVSITCDGFTELEVSGAWTGLLPGTGTAVGDGIDLALEIDGGASWFIFAPLKAEAQIRVDSTSTVVFGGGTIRNWATPPAGTHTVSMLGSSFGHAFTVNDPFIRVASSLQQ